MLIIDDYTIHNDRTICVPYRTYTTTKFIFLLKNYHCTINIVNNQIGR